MRFRERGVVVNMCVVGNSSGGTPVLTVGEAQLFFLLTLRYVVPF